jgi:hypothetical protein
VLPVNRLTERVGYYFDRDPETSRDEEAVPQEIHWSEQREHHKDSRYSSTRRPPSAEDLRLHAWLTERLAELRYERHGLWPRLRRFFFGTD